MRALVLSLAILAAHPAFAKAARPSARAQNLTSAASLSTPLAAPAASSPIAPPRIITALSIDPAVPVAPAYTTEDEKLEAVLSFVFRNEARKFGWPANYQSMWCPTNAFNLLKRLQQSGVDLSHAEVWYLLPSETAAGGVDPIIHPRQARPNDDGVVNEWSFHVVIEVEGRILDLDFKTEPEVLSEVNYAAQMWQKGPLAHPVDARPLYVRRVPAMDYLTQYANNWDFYISGGGGRYPAVEMSSLFPTVTSPSAGNASH